MEDSITPDPTAPLSPRDVGALLTGMRADIDQLQLAVQGGKLADAHTLAPQVAALMTALQDLPKDAARQHLSALESLCQALDGLVGSYKHLAESSATGLQQIPTLLRASNAYAKQGAVTGSVSES